MKALVTGGAGFVGSSLVRSLLDQGFSVRVLDKTAGKLAESKDLEILLGGIEDLKTVKSAMKDVEVVYHLAESYSPQPVDVFEIDVKGNVLVDIECLPVVKGQVERLVSLLPQGEVVA